MIEVLPERCTECGECIAVCSHDAIHLEGGQTVIDNRLCTECLACQQVCPVITIQEGETEIAPTALSGEVVYFPSAAVSQLQRSQFLPIIGAALLWTGREISPRISTLALSYLSIVCKKESLAKRLPEMGAPAGYTAGVYVSGSANTMGMAAAKMILVKGDNNGWR